jgi:hypothetical protein
MSNPFLQIANASASGFQRRGLGFLQTDSDNGAEDWGGFFYDDFGNYWEYDWFNANDGGGSLPFFDFTSPFIDNSPTTVSASANEDRYWFDWGQYLSDWLNGNVLSIDTYGQRAGQQPYGGDSGFSWPDGIGPGPAPLDPQYGPAGTGQGLPGYCPQGTYHPLNDPFACVPFPPNDPKAKRQAQQQQKAAQNAANAAKKAQQQKDKQCPRDPQGRPVWFNPQTGKCELVPQCAPGSKFDSTARRCLTANELKQLYGDSNWLIWLLIGGGTLLLLSNRDSGRRRR